MSFASIQSEILARCNLTSSDASTRVGIAINAHHRRITSLIGMDSSRFVSITDAMTIGTAYNTFALIEKIHRVLDITTAASPRLLVEVSLDSLRSEVPGTGQPTRWALQANTYNGVTILTDTLPTVAYSLQADGIAPAADLSSTDQPLFPASYHSILTWNVMAEELMRKEKPDLADWYLQRAEKLERDLIFQMADTPGRDLVQGSRLDSYPPREDRLY